MKIQLTSLNIETFNSKNEEHLKYLKELINDQTIKERFTGLNLKIKKESKEFELDRGYLVSIEDKIIGYVGISNINLHNQIYLRITIRNQYRNRGLATETLNEISEYLTTKYDLESIRLVIAKDNISSLKSASKSGFTWIENDIYAFKKTRI